MSLPIVFINLDRDAERRTRLLAELQQIDMQSERFRAVWWADDAIAQRPLQFAQYLEAAIALQQGTPLVKKKRRWWRRLLG